MNNEEAKFLLNAARPNGDDADDPAVREALRQAERDPQLRDWLVQQRTLDAVIARQLKSVPVPTDLRAAILAGGRASRKVIWWRRPAWLAAAAALVLLVGLSAVLLRSSIGPGSRDFQSEIIRLSGSDQHVDAMVSGLPAIKDWLRTRSAPDDFTVPAGLAQAMAKGCRVLDWHGRKVTLICFHLNGGNHVDLFVIDSADIPGVRGRSDVALVEGMPTASWQQAGKTYVLSGKVAPEQLKELLKG